MTPETDKETIKRRQRNADSFFGCLGEALGCAWIASCFALVSVVTVWMR